MASVTKDTILKNLATLYWNAFHGGKWHIALQVLEWQGNNKGIFETRYLSETARITSMRGQWQDLTGTRKKLDPELTHPPPPPAPCRSVESAR